MYSFRKIQAMVLGGHQDDNLCEQLRTSAVPVSAADCRSCSDPCDLGHEGYPSRFKVDMDTEMLGSVKPYHRQIVISTGKSDWERDISDDKSSLAAAIQEISTNVNTRSHIPKSPPSSNGKAARPVTGLFQTSDSSKTSILNGSHSSLNHDDTLESILVFPDFKVVTEVRRSLQGAQALWDNAVDPSVGRNGAHMEKSPLKSWVLPYSCVILLCSHKKRDNRCGISAPKLEHAFIQSLESLGYEAHTQLESPSITMGSPLEDLQLTPDELEGTINNQLKESTECKRVLIIKTSHIGGHRYAGNCIIYTPSGSGVWYGRVTPHDVESIVVNTIMKGLVLPPLLRGGLNLSRPNCKSLNDW